MNLSLSVWNPRDLFLVSEALGPFSMRDLNVADLVSRAVQIGLSLVQAFLILLIGWLASKLVRSIVVRALHKTQIDNHLAALLTGGRKERLAVEETVGTLVYGVMMLFVSIEVLRALGLTMVTEPLNDLLGQVTGFVPQLFAAASVALVAWVLAGLARVLISNLLQGRDLDRRLGEAIDDEGTPSLAKTLSDAGFYLVLLFFLPQVLDALRMEGLTPVKEMVGQILSILPNLLGVVIMLAVFYFVARIVQRLVVPLLGKVGFDRLPEALGLEGTQGPKASTVAGWVVMGSLLSMGFVQGAEMLGLELVSNAVQGLVMGMGRMLLASGIVAVGLYLGRLVQTAVAQWEAGQGRAGTPLARTARWAILCLAGAMALGQTGLAPEITQMTFGAFVFGAAIAGGLAFGLGGRESAARWLESRRSGSS